jgi:ABC-type branched-subunit amino acid transport system substrate-binding protein
MKNIFFLFFTLITVSFSQQDDEVYFYQPSEDYFLLGMRQFTQNDYKAAMLSFQNSISAFPMNHRITASTIMLAKSHYALKDYLGASVICDSFIVRFPASLYIEDAHFVKGMCYYNEGLYVNTLKEMERVYSLAQQKLNKQHAYKVIDHVATEFLKEGDIESLLETTVNDTVRSLLKVTAAEKSFAARNTDRAKELLADFSDPMEDHVLQVRANHLLARIERGNIVHVGVLLPLFSDSVQIAAPERKIATEVLQGIQLSVLHHEEHLQPNQVSIEVDVKDTQRRPPLIDSIITEWGSENSIVGIVGPVFSDETIAAAQRAQQERIPLVSPTATEEGISQIGEYVFQANSSISMRAKIMAQYVTNVLGAKNVAILASDFPSSTTQADSFSAEIVRLGGTVVIDRRYARGSTDLRSYFREIRKTASALNANYVVSLKGKINVADVKRKLVSFGAKISTIDSVLAADGNFNLTKIFFDQAKEIGDSLHLPVQVVMPYADSLNYPVTSIDVIFCPISKSQQIGVITSQMEYFNIDAKIVGTPEWKNLSELEMNRRYANGVIFGSDQWIDRSDPLTQRVSSMYSGTYGKPISDNVLFGFDVMSLVIEQLDHGALSREDLQIALSAVENFKGIRNNITLSHGRVNGNLHILQYKDGAISKLQTYTYQ